MFRPSFFWSYGTFNRDFLKNSKPGRLIEPVRLIEWWEYCASIFFFIKSLKIWNFHVLDFVIQWTICCQRYLNLAQPEDKIQCTYVWIGELNNHLEYICILLTILWQFQSHAQFFQDGTGENLRSKTKTIKFVPKSPKGMENTCWLFCTYIFLIKAS